MRKILVLNFFPAFFPPASGGELRYYNMYHHLSKYHDITLLSPTYSDHKHECVTHSDTFREYRIPKEPIYNQIYMELMKEKICSEVSALSCAISADYPNKYHEYYHKLYKDADIIIHESPYMLNYDVFWGLDGKPRVYNSYNYETKLVEQMWKGENAPKYVKYIAALEKKLCQKANIVFATSEEEKAAFINDFDIEERKVFIAPNGINTNELNRASNVNNNPKRAFFIGSGHPPNIEAVDFIINNLADANKDIDFYIAGSCCTPLADRPQNSNIKLLGRVLDEDKKKLFESVDIAINPMFSGAGTNLKTLEFLASGIPMISTSVGVRGIEIENNTHFVLADTENFNKKIRHLLSDKELLKNISENGKKYVEEHFSWATIASHVNSVIEKITPLNIRKTIIVLNDFEAANPSAGGEIRMHYIYRYLSNKYNVILLCLNETEKTTVTNITQNFWQISVPKTSEHMNEQRRLNSKYYVSSNDIVASYMCTRNELLVGIFDNLYKFSNLIILSHPYMARLVEDINTMPIIYESHNYETKLKNKILKDHPDFNFLMEKVKETEILACEKSKIIITVADEEREIFKQRYPNKKVFTIRNGVEIKDKEYLNINFNEIRKTFSGYPVATFLGSGHMPNVESAQFIINELSSKMPDFYFCIIGSVCDAVSHLRIPDNVILFGRLKESHKDALISVSDIFLNPVFSGAGSNLKIADAFAKKIPVVSTAFGTRGYNIEHKKKVIIAEPQDFATAIRSLYDDKELQRTITENAYKYTCKEINWQSLAYKFKDIIEAEILKSNRKKLLIVTYRFTEPTLGGAEVYLMNLLKGLDASGNFDIDICTFDVKEIYNKYHFGAELTFDNSVAFSDDLKNTGVFKFSTDILKDNEMLENSRVIYKSWYLDSIEISQKFVQKYDRSLLMGGFNYPEKYGNGYSIWTSDNVLLFVKQAKTATLKFYSPIKNKINVLIDNEHHREFQINGHGEIRINLAKPNSVINLKLKSLFIDPSDPRQLGINITAILLDNQELNLDYDYKQFLKEYYLDDYISALIANARIRDNSIDQLFFKTRGPISEQLEYWLDSNISKYDVVLGQGVPFSTSVLTSKYAKKYSKPFALLPHYHMEDEYYHWNMYYEAFNSANIVFAAPDISKKMFFDKIGVNSKVIPGGAIHLHEYNVKSNKDFKNLYKSDLPFILVLGRKSGAKNYKCVINAIDEINKDKYICNLVMIGKDEDGYVITSNNVVYLGMQSRNVVLSALSECAFLVTMSSSESFGIIILEAWASSKAVIVNENCAAYTELVQDNVNGMYANKDNLARKIGYLLSNKSIANQMAEYGRKKINDYTWQGLSDKVNDLLLGLREDG